MATTKLRIGTNQQKALLLKRLRDWHGGKLAFERVCLACGLPQPKPGRSKGKAGGWRECHTEFEKWLNAQSEFEVRRQAADLGFGSGTLIFLCLVETD